MTLCHSLYGHQLVLTVSSLGRRWAPQLRFYEDSTAIGHRHRKANTDSPQPQATSLMRDASVCFPGRGTIKDGDRSLHSAHGPGCVSVTYASWSLGIPPLLHMHGALAPGPPVALRFCLTAPHRLEVSSRHRP